MTPAEQRLVLFHTTTPADRTVIACRSCGGADAVDHVTLTRVRCSRCDVEADFPRAFALLRGRYLDHDASRALAQPHD